MSDFDFEGPLESDWDDRGDLAWNEFDWERYLREQDEAIVRYLGFYEQLRHVPERIDEAARRMGWEPDGPAAEAEADDDREPEEAADDFGGEEDVYTLHKNPVFIATKAITLSLSRAWERAAREPGRIPPPLALSFLGSIHRGEDRAVQAIHALDFGDYAMAVSLFKRALGALNESLALVSEDGGARPPLAAAIRESALARLFDLREIWLRVINECRDELERPTEE
jgi:hypothetical protein